MKITILCSSEEHPINSWLFDFCTQNQTKHQLVISRSASELDKGDILFLVSCNEVLAQADLDLFDTAIVLHASDLPLGRGWSPHIWQILDGQNDIIVTAFEANNEIDTGDIWGKISVHIQKTDLYDDINFRIFSAELSLMQRIVDSYESIEPVAQCVETEPNYYRKRSPNDSRLNIHKTIAEQFDLLRVSDPLRYPAFFEHHGQKYKLLIEKIKDDSEN